MAKNDNDDDSYNDDDDTAGSVMTDYSNWSQVRFGIGSAATKGRTIKVNLVRVVAARGL